MRTKLRPPPLQPGLLERPELLLRLRDGGERTLTLVSAPAGYGKTTLLAQWAEVDAGRRHFVWISLDELDSDPLRLWGHAIDGLREAHGRAGERSLPALATAPRAISETAVPLLVEELEDCPPIALVFDDWHLVRSRACDETVGAFVERAPPSVQVVVSSRADPGLPLARLRAHGELAEIRARDLRVTPGEAARVLEEAGVSLRPADASRLAEKTEGWLAGLYLAALVVREQDDPESFVRGFAGDSRHVFDYLVGDVLANVEPDARDFLVRSSVLERLSAPLCDAVLERSDSAAMLSTLDRSNLFVVPLDPEGREYRYHRLFAAVVRRALSASYPDSIPALHGRASRWYEEQGDEERAIEHAIAGRDLARATGLVLIATIPFLSRGRMATLDRWFEMLSWPEALADRQLAVCRAVTARLSGQGRDEVEHWLGIAESGPDFGPLPNGIASILSSVAMVSSMHLTRGVEDAVRAARFVLESHPETSSWRYAGLAPLGQALFLAGRPDEAREPLEAAQALPDARRRIATALGLAYLALVELSDGDLERAEALARDAVALAEELGHGQAPGGANPHLALGCVLMRGPDLHGAVAHLARAADLAHEDSASYWRAHALLHLAEAHRRLGHGDAAQETLTRARHELDGLLDLGILAALYKDVEGELHHRARREGYLGEELSDAERRVLALLADGVSVSEAAHELWLSPNTVRTHRRSIYRKLGASTRQEMLERARAAGLHDGRDVHPGD